ncbi:hypothetical protein, partial [Sessilibacter sp. MAH1]
NKYKNSDFAVLKVYHQTFKLPYFLRLNLPISATKNETALPYATTLLIETKKSKTAQRKQTFY